jgi:hypothetical protein
MMSVLFQTLYPDELMYPLAVMKPFLLTYIHPVLFVFNDTRLKDVIIETGCQTLLFRLSVATGSSQACI